MIEIDPVPTRLRVQYVDRKIERLMSFIKEELILIDRNDLGADHKNGRTYQFLRFELQRCRNNRRLEIAQEVENHFQTIKRITAL